MNYQVQVKYKDGRVIIKKYKQYGSAIKFYNREAATFDTAYGKKNYEAVKFFVNGSKVMERRAKGFKWFNLCPKCGSFNTERTIGLCCVGVTI